jgi:hypothetical protein
MTLRRVFGWLALLAMIQFIVAGTASACVAAGGGTASATSKHTDCAPGSSHSNGSKTSGATEVPCCTAFASCATAALAARTVSIDSPPQMMAIAVSFAAHAPRAEAPAPELPPPKA